MNLDMSTIGLMPPRLLLVHGDEFEAQVLCADLEAFGCKVETCATAEEFARRCKAETWDAILADQETASVSDFAEVLSGPDAPILVVLSGFGSIDDAVEAVRAGASDFLTKPVSSEQLRVALGRALERRDLQAENRRLREDLGERYELGKLTSRSPEMQRVFEMVRNVADTRATLLIEGESGTGKTVLARSVHAASSRASGPFVEVNCGALPDTLLESELFGHERGAFTGAVKTRPGKFEVADGGTIFLDEIACASLDLQIKLLRVLQDREFERVGSSETQVVDVRVIAATNQPLREEVAAGRFREDLFYRLNVLDLVVPPLRDRRGDVVMLAERFLAELSTAYGREIEGFEPRALAALTAHDWPGNVRELENSIERAVLLSSGALIPLEALPDELRAAAVETSDVPTGLGLTGELLHGRGLREALELAEKELILWTLRENEGSRKATARRLGINRTTLFNKMTRFGLMDLDFETSSDLSSPPQQR